MSVRSLAFLWATSVLVLWGLLGQPSKGHCDDTPSVVGTWKLVSAKFDGVDKTTEKAKEASAFKFRKDGSCLFLGGEWKSYSYDRDEGEITLRNPGIFADEVHKVRVNFLAKDQLRLRGFILFSSYEVVLEREN